MTFNKIRRLLYRVARIMGDVQSVRSGNVGKRVGRRVAGRIAGKGLGKLFR